MTHINFNVKNYQQHCDKQILKRCVRIKYIENTRQYYKTGI